MERRQKKELILNYELMLIEKLEKYSLDFWRMSASFPLTARRKEFGCFIKLSPTPLDFGNIKIGIIFRSPEEMDKAIAMIMVDFLELEYENSFNYEVNKNEVNVVRVETINIKKITEHVILSVCSLVKNFKIKKELLKRIYKLNNR